MMRGYALPIAILAWTTITAGQSSSEFGVVRAEPQIWNAKRCLPPSDLDDLIEGRSQFEIADVTFQGATGIPASEQKQIAASIKQKTRGQRFDDVVAEALERARNGWQDLGYFKVDATSKVRLLDDDTAHGRIALTIKIAEGDRYTLGSIGFRHNAVFGDTTILRALFPIQDGEIFSRGKVAKGLDNLREAYEAQGYIKFTAIPDTEFDEVNKQVSLDIDLDEGEQFYLGSVNLLGVEEATRAHLLANLNMKTGQVFDEKIYEAFVIKYAGDLLHQRRTIDLKARTVNLTFDFDPCEDWFSQ